MCEQTNIVAEKYNMDSLIQAFPRFQKNEGGSNWTRKIIATPYVLLVIWSSPLKAKDVDGCKW